VRVLEKLRERQHDRHLQAESLREVKQLDETASRCRSTEEDP
jgi:flagellar biosynthesis chaperone FliJ